MPCNFRALWIKMYPAFLSILPALTLYPILFLRTFLGWNWKLLNRFLVVLPRSSSPGQHHSPLSSRHHSSSSQSGSSIQRHSPSPRRKRTPSPSYQRTLTPSLRRSASPYPTHCLSSPQRKQSPPRHRSPLREKGRHDHERTSQSHDRRHERREGILCIWAFCFSGFLYFILKLHIHIHHYIRKRRGLCCTESSVTCRLGQ